jgi:hypothetical protein
VSHKYSGAYVKLLIRNSVTKDFLDVLNAKHTANRVLDMIEALNSLLESHTGIDAVQQATRSMEPPRVQPPVQKLNLSLPVRL